MGFSKILRGLSLRSIPVSACVFLAVFSLRLLVLARLTESPFLLPAQGDMHFYNEWAQKITRGEWTDHQAFYGLPLYPFLLAGLYGLFGFSPFIPGFLQACLEGGTAIFLFKLGRGIFASEAERDGNMAGPTEQTSAFSHRGTAIGLLAAAGWAVYLPAQSYSLILMPTAWLVFVFWWIVWQIIRRQVAPSYGWFLFLGLVIGVAAMGIATILFLVPLVLGALIFRWKPNQPEHFRWRQIAIASLLLAFGIGLGTSPAWLHNRVVARDPVFLSAHSGVNLWIGNNPGANGYPRFPLGLRAGQQAMLKDSITGAEAAAGRPLRRSEVSQYWSAKAKAYIAEHPLAWSKLILTKIANFWSAFQYDDISVITSLREQAVTLPGFRFGLIAALALAGMVVALPAFSASRWILAAVLLHMMSLLSVFVTERYRLAAVPGLLVFAAAFVWQLWHAVASQRHRRAIALFATILATAWIVSVRKGDAELWALDPYNSGLHALDAKELDVAERKLKLAYAYVPTNAELNFALGNLHLARSDPQNARALYARTLVLDPRHEGALNNLGVLSLGEQQWDGAIRFFEAALEVEPKDAKTHYLLARALFASGQRARALRAVELAIQLDHAQPEFAELRDLIRGGTLPK